MQQEKPIKNPFNILNNEGQQKHAVVTAHSLNKNQIKKEQSRMKSTYNFQAKLEDAQKHQQANMFGYSSHPSEV